jgi:hypothetical protein
VLSVIFGLVLASNAPEFRADRFSLGQRLRRVEAAWVRATPAHKAKALPEIEQAVLRFFGGGLADACRRLDAASLALGEPSAPFDLRLSPLFGPSDAPVEVVLEWTYPAEGEARVIVQGREHLVEPGRPFRVALAKPRIQGQRINESVRWEWSGKRGAWLLKAGRGDRLVELARQSGPLSEIVRDGLQADARLETDLLGSGLFEGDPRSLLVLRDGVPIRARLADRPSKTPVALVFLHGAGGSEHMVFEALGAGMMAKKALARGWSVFAPRLGGKSVEAAISLARSRLGEETRIVLAGHSAGGAAIARALASGIRPKAVALFAPAAPPPRDLAKVPVFVAVGKREMAGLRTMAVRWAEVPGVEVREEPLAEHLMVVAEAAESALRFLERHLR